MFCKKAHLKCVKITSSADLLPECHILMPSCLNLIEIPEIYLYQYVDRTININRSLSIKQVRSSTIYKQ